MCDSLIYHKEFFMKPKTRPDRFPREEASNVAGKEVRSLSNLIMRFISTKLNKEYVETATGANAWILQYIKCHEGQDVYQRDLEKEFCITRSTASKVVILMEKKGFLSREGVESDGRLKKLVLTEKGNNIINLMAEDRETVEKTLIKGFSDEEIQQFCSFIARMKENVQGELNK